MKKLLLGLAIVLLLAGCAEFNSRVTPSAKLGGYQHIFVQHSLADGRGLDGIIAQELRRLGYDAAAGPLTLMPKNTELVLLYQDRWSWDFTTYMIELNMQVMTAHSGRMLAEAHTFRPSLVGHPPVQLIDQILDNWFKPRVPSVPQTPPVDN
jgi:hypothetical protein